MAVFYDGVYTLEICGNILFFLIVTFGLAGRIKSAIKIKSFIHQAYCNMTDKEYNHCVTLYADNVYRFVLKNLGHRADAEDIVQAAFEKMWINRVVVENGRCKSYLFTVAYNQMIDHIRKNKRISLRDQFNENSLVGTNASQDTKKILNEALGKLTDLQKSLVLLKDYEGYSYQEIGEITGLNESQVKVYLHRARLILRKWLVKTENVL